MATPFRRQRGATLVEALIGFLVLSMGVLGAARLQSWLRLNGDIARQRTEAVRFAQQDLEQIRASADAAAFNTIATHQSTTNAAPTAFTLTRAVNAASGVSLKTSTVSVSWLDRSGATQAIHLQSQVSGTSPKYSAALALASQDQTLAPRSHLPAGAKILSEGRSVFKPSSRSTVAWVINNATGLVTAQCSVSAALAKRDITEADLTNCSAVAGHLLSGYIRFSLATVPDAEHANDAPLALSINLVPDTTPARCETEETVMPERYLAYTCFVPQGGSGPLRIVPEGWAFGETSSTFKACRYNGGPATQARQNYLVIRGDIACPTGLPPHNGVSVATVQYQP